VKNLFYFLIIIFLLLFPINSYSQLIWSTYFGGNDFDYVQGMEIDDSKNVYLSGLTRLNNNFPITEGAYKRDFQFESNFVSKFNPSCSKLIFSTFIGESYIFMIDIKVDKFGNSYITGSTSFFQDIPITRYPTTPNAYDTSFNGDISHNDRKFDGYVTKLNNRGDSLIYSTYLGGNAYDVGVSLVIDKIYNAYITGITSSNNFPTTLGAFDTIYNGTYNDNYDIFITKINNLGSNLIYSTFLGGSLSDWPNAIVIDDSYNSYITGCSGSENFPTTPNAFVSKIPSNHFNTIISKIDSTGSALIFSTFIGDDNNSLHSNEARSLVIDKEKNVYITGYTSSPDFPTTLNAYDRSFGGGFGNNYDIIITKLNHDGDYLLYSTFLGDTGIDQGQLIKLTANNNVILSGTTSSRNFPITKDAYQQYFKDSLDYFISGLSANGDKLRYSSFFGSTGITNWFMSNSDRILLDSLNNLYIAGNTSSDHFPVTNGAFDVSYNGDVDIFVSKLNLCSCLPLIDSIKYPTVLCWHYADDTIEIRNNCFNTLIMADNIFSGMNKSEFSIIKPDYFPYYLLPGDSVKLIIRFTPNSVKGIKTASIYFPNNFSYDYTFNLIGYNEKTVDYLINKIGSDTILIDLGTICPGSVPKDTTITIFNKSSIGTTFKIENKDPQLQITPIGKAGKKEDDSPQGVKKK
jgi:hypothetical protein